MLVGYTCGSPLSHTTIGFPSSMIILVLRSFPHSSYYSAISRAPLLKPTGGNSSCDVTGVGDGHHLPGVAVVTNCGIAVGRGVAVTTFSCILTTVTGLQAGSAIAAIGSKYFAFMLLLPS